MGLDYYEILGVEQDSNEAEIRKAYRKLALQWHPDKNQNNKEEAERRFKLISEAYDVLSDPNKREVFDQYGEEGLKNGPPPGAEFNYAGFQFHTAEEIFRNTFRNDPFFANFFGNSGFGPRFGGPGFGGPGFGFDSGFDSGFASPFFSEPFGNSPFGFPTVNHGFPSSSSSWSSFGGGNVTSTSTSTTTTFVNGKPQTTTKTVTTNNGVSTTTTTVLQGNRVISQSTMSQNSGGHQLRY